jgi:hypothetical protein
MDTRLCLLLLMFITASMQETIFTMSAERPINTMSSSPFLLNKDMSFRTEFSIPFPQCVQTDAAAKILHPSSIQQLFQVKLQQEEAKLKQERTRNNNLRNSKNSMKKNR